MKNLLLGTFFITTAVSYANEMGMTSKKNNLYIKTGVNLWSEYDSFFLENKKTTNGETDNIGFELGIEGTRNINN